jgi:xanthine dehydrogenase small subunit
LGGNIANGSPIGDSMPWLITLGATVTLANTAGQRTMPLEDLYVDYMKQSMNDDEVVASVSVPLPSADLTFRTYKLSKRYDSDISAVCAAFVIRQSEGLITDARVAFGGMAAIPKRAAQTEAALIGQAWNEQTAKQAMLKLAEDYTPLADMRASADNRSTSAANLLYRFYLETCEGDQGDQGSETNLSVFAH